MNGREQPQLDRLVAVTDHRLEGRDHVADHIFGGVVQQHGKSSAAVEPRYLLPRQYLDQQSVLRHRIDMRALGLAVPARDAGEAMGNVFELDIERRRVKQVEPAARQHALPGAGFCRTRARLFHLCVVFLRASFAHAAWRWQSTRWSLTMPVACMKA